MHGVESEHELEDGEEFAILCYCGFKVIGERTVEHNARNTAYAVYRKHLIDAMRKESK